MKIFTDLPREVKAMFWTMAIIAALALFVFLVYITEGIALLVAFGLILAACIYFVVLDEIRP